MITSCKYCDVVYDTKGNEHITKEWEGLKLPDFKEFAICPQCKHINCVYIKEEKVNETRR